MINVLDELGTASGKTAAQVGKLAHGRRPAEFASARGRSNWGAWSSEIFGLDEKIGELSRPKLLGWGDVAGQQAAAGAETLARASANAGRQDHRHGGSR